MNFPKGEAALDEIPFVVKYSNTRCTINCYIIFTAITWLWKARTDKG